MLAARGRDRRGPLALAARIGTRHQAPPRGSV